MDSSQHAVGNIMQKSAFHEEIEDTSKEPQIDDKKDIKDHADQNINNYEKEKSKDKKQYLSLKELFNNNKKIVKKSKFKRNKKTDSK